MRKICLAVTLVIALALSPNLAGAVGSNGAPGIGDSDFPFDGNGGYQIEHYGLNLRYNPTTDRLSGVATLTGKTLQALSRFNLDFDGMSVRSVTVNGHAATWSRNGGELRITPPGGLRSGKTFVAVIGYDGVPIAPLEGAGFLPTDDGALVVGQPHVASTWYPVNDHPRDEATYDISLNVPDGLEAISNGALISHNSSGGRTIWVWQETAPMASYLATATIGQFDINEFTDGGIDYLDAVDPDLNVQIAPQTGSQFAYTDRASLTYKRLMRQIEVPNGGATLTFKVYRDTEPPWDFFFVEARDASGDDWTTLPDENGHTSDDVGFSCPFWLELHPFLEHYQTDDGAGGCDPTGTTGEWNAATGFSGGWETWTVDLGQFANSTAEISITHASDDTIQNDGVAVDDIVVSTGEGSTSFEDDGNELDGWTVPGAPEGSEANENDWAVLSASEAPPSLGARATDALDLEPEIIDFLSQQFGPYPFEQAGGLVDDLRDVGFALENQTRPIYAPEFFFDELDGESVVVHELAHQWFGDHVSLFAWKHIWLNEGFATYAEWLWSEHQGRDSAQDIFDDLYAAIPANDDFWTLPIGNPGADFLFETPVYFRGAMALHQLRVTVGDADFFEILQQWAEQPATSTTRHFKDLAEQVSGMQLDDFFQDWLFDTDKPDIEETAPEGGGTVPEWLVGSHAGRE